MRSAELVKPAVDVIVYGMPFNQNIKSAQKRGLDSSTTK
jgi:hypothetical protein